MVIISGINVLRALKINLTEEQKLLVNVTVAINFQNILTCNDKNQRHKQPKSMSKIYMYVQAKGNHTEAF